jgi:hypothetical protein
MGGGHPDVHDDEVGLQRPDQGKKFRRVACLTNDLETGPLEQAGQSLPQQASSSASATRQVLMGPSHHASVPHACFLLAGIPP